MAIAPPNRTTTTTSQHFLTVPTSTHLSPTTPSITSSPLFSAPTHDIAMLHDIHTLLDRIFVRNRNQHRRSTWWKALHGFRKQMALLLADLQDKQVREVERRRKVEARLRAWDAKGEVHAWYLYVLFSPPLFSPSFRFLSYPPASFFLPLTLHFVTPTKNHTNIFFTANSVS